ncbi:MAG: hypothetical protein C4520_08525 [Candidatus Abyssobacteria bacterium SURF_5]|uniref:Glycosyltransferase RgtA/B/C/D-like domain-containing protein n=1 Tax=Abyssobacteria bacterium (strain SURF_5) TaxID=2093360 RepID=A0A3A4P2N4_ABYX5|nr:MAG: hypothetical protein C4520_08525 [Candidatus Abyssubacteria bacterium SURF_5]
MQNLKDNLSDTLIRPRRQNSLQHFLFLSICALLALKTFLFIVQVSKTLIYPFEWSTMDGYFVFYGLRLLSGSPIYFSYQSLLMPLEYVPVFPLVIGALAKVFGPAVWYERAFSLLCACGMAAIIVRAVSKNSTNRLAPAFAGLLFFAPASLSIWFVVRGIDITAAFLALAGVAAVSRPQVSPRRIALAIALFAAAFYTKQTAIFPAAAAIIYFAAQRQWRHCAFLSAGFIALSAGTFFLLQHLSGGWFLENAFLMTANNPFLPGLLVDLFSKFALTLFIVFPIALYQAGRGIRSAGSIWSFYFFCTLAAAFLAGKAGAALSYFIPLFSAVCISAGQWLGHQDPLKRKPRAAAVILVLLLLQSLLFFREKIPAPDGEDFRQAAILDSWIIARPGNILIERIDSFAVNNGRELNVEAVQLPILVMHRKYDPDLVIRPLREKAFSLVVYSGVYFGGIPAVKKAVFENYRVVDEVQIGLFFGKMNFLILAPSES